MWKTLESNTLVDTYHVSVKKDKVQLPDWAVIDDFYTVTIPEENQCQQHGASDSESSKAA